LNYFNIAVGLSEAFQKPITSVYNAIKFAGYALPVLFSFVYMPYLQNRLKAVQPGCIDIVLVSSGLACVWDKMSENPSRATF